MKVVVSHHAIYNLLQYFVSRDQTSLGGDLFNILFFFFLMLFQSICFKGNA